MLFYKTIFLFYLISGSFTKGFGFRFLDKIFPWFRKKTLPPDISPDIQNIITQRKYDLQWFVIGTSSMFAINKPYKITIWNKDYVIWKSSTNKYYAFDNTCSHNGASLSDGIITPSNCISCPHHSYTFNTNGYVRSDFLFSQTTDFVSSDYNIQKYDILERNGWIYVNTFIYDNTKLNKTLYTNIYEEHESHEEKSLSPFSKVLHFNIHIYCNPFIVNELFLHILHMNFLHIDKSDILRNYPKISENMKIKELPKRIGAYHFRIIYAIKDVVNSFSVSNNKTVLIENDFILPYSTITRIQLGEKRSAMITSIQPISAKHIILYVKFYQNYDYDFLFVRKIKEILTEKKRILEGIETINTMDTQMQIDFGLFQKIYKHTLQLFSKYIYPYIS